MLQKNVRLGWPISEKAAYIRPKSPCVSSVAELSTRVMPLSASRREWAGVISVITPLAAGADPDANGSRNPANEVC